MTANRETAANPQPGGRPETRAAWKPAGGRATRAGRHGRVESPGGPPLVDIVIPVRNQQDALAGYVARVHEFLAHRFPLPWQLTIVDGASVDGTWALASRLTQGYPGVSAWRLPVPGRGAALREAWLASSAAIVAYLDIAVSPDPRVLLPLVTPLASGHADMCAGSRFVPGARRPRGGARNTAVRGYNLALGVLFGTRYSDAACGAKAARLDAIRPLLGVVADDSRFFDTGLLLVAARHGLRVHEVPVPAVAGRSSTADLGRAVYPNVAGAARLAWAMARGRGTVPGISARHRTAAHRERVPPRARTVRG